MTQRRRIIPDKEELEPLLDAKEKQDKEMSSALDEKMTTISASRDSFPPASFARYRQLGERRLPQSIAHRGYKAICPENTLCAFRAAVEKGRAHALETDIHLSKDNVVVLSHDLDLKRCFGRKEKIIDCDWEYLSGLRTLAAPHEPMPRLHDLLEYMSQPELQEIWLLLDIKVDNNTDNVMRLIAETIASIPPGGPKPWKDRVVLGIWTAEYLSYCTKYLDGFPVAHIGFAPWYARQFLKVPNVGFNMFFRTLFGPIGSRFIHDVHNVQRPLYFWTINDESLMKWGIKKRADGVITDDPKLFNEVCDRWKNGDEKYVRITLRNWLSTLWLYLMMVFFTFRLRRLLKGNVNTFLDAEKTKGRTATGPRARIKAT